MTTLPNIASAPLRTKYGDFKLFVFSWSDNEQDNVLVLYKKFDIQPLVRVQSACYTGEIFESLDCDCHWQLETSLHLIQQEGGLFIYMLCDGRGAGLLAKVKGLALTAEKHVDTADAYRELRISLDPREYSQPIYILKHFGVTSLRLLTNNPRKIDGLVRGGFEVIRKRLESESTAFNREYLRCKATKLGHLMREFGTDES